MAEHLEYQRDELLIIETFARRPTREAFDSKASRFGRLSHIVEHALWRCAADGRRLRAVCEMPSFRCGRTGFGFTSLRSDAAVLVAKTLQGIGQTGTPRQQQLVSE